MTQEDFDKLQKEMVELREKVERQEEIISEFTSEEDSPQKPSLTDILENPEVTKAVNTAVNAWAGNQPEEMKLRSRSLYLSIGFSAVVLVTIGLLGYLGVLSKDVTGSLLGALIGYWYGKYQGRQSTK